MSLFHKHNWQEIERFYAPPENRWIKNAPRELVEEIVFGVTTILYKCSCGKYKRIKVLGKGLKESATSP